MAQAIRKVLVFFNPKSGKAEQGVDIRAELARHFAPPNWSLDIQETTGDDDVTARCRDACAAGAALVISAGGDGTVGGVANGLVNTNIPLGILPLGTGNDLARALRVPLDLKDALELLSGDHAVAEIDALKVGDRYFFSNVSVGMSPVMMQETKSEQKKRFGLLAYVWTLVKRSSILQLHRYMLTVDGRRWRVRASEVLISSPTLLEKPPFIFGPTETLSDGQFEIYLINAHTVGEYLSLIWNAIVHPGQPSATLLHWTGRRTIRIDDDRHLRPVQADGDVIGNTPVDVQLVPRALRAVTPKPAPSEGGIDKTVVKPLLATLGSDRSPVRARDDGERGGMDRATEASIQHELAQRPEAQKHLRRLGLRRAIVASALVVALAAFLNWLPAESRRNLVASLFANRPLIALLILFAMIALSLLWSFGQRLDVWIFRALNPRGYQAKWLDRAMSIASLLGNQWFIALLVVVAYVLGNHGFAFALALGSLTLWLVVTIIKALTDRARPFNLMSETRVIGYRERGLSFPSGHTAQTFYWVTLASSHLRLSIYVAIGLYFLATLVAITRVYLGVHYPRDVIAGAVLAVIWGGIGVLVAPYL